MLDKKTLEEVYEISRKQEKYIKAIEKLNYKIAILDSTEKLLKYYYIDCFISTPNVKSLTISICRYNNYRSYMYDSYIKINQKVDDYVKKILNLEADKFDMLGLHD